MSQRFQLITVWKQMRFVAAHGFKPQCFVLRSNLRLSCHNVCDKKPFFEIFLFLGVEISRLDAETSLERRNALAAPAIEH
jgi:hypothetical protein